MNAWKVLSMDIGKHYYCQVVRKLYSLDGSVVTAKMFEDIRNPEWKIVKT